ncbi:MULTISPECIES: hypothetical protein [Photorhabdus]|nr:MULTISPECIES: hypothetical protein [Photorhabdus]NDK94594.1 hypothetical protein [Photorhabdus laumondii subsp. laumondii]NDL46964.1 hypothetical protein [Photorhabdus laumondii subsp. laumondii]
MTGVSECSQQRGNLKDNGYISLIIFNDLNLVNLKFYRLYLTIISDFT